MSGRFLDQKTLSHRWGLSERTLERWRFERRGPRYLKLVGKVVYRINDIEQFEELNLRETEVIADQSPAVDAS